jgi:hypothetical protein
VKVATESDVERTGQAAQNIYAVGFRFAGHGLRNCGPRPRELTVTSVTKNESPSRNRTGLAVGMLRLRNWFAIREPVSTLSMTNLIR